MARVEEQLAVARGANVRHVRWRQGTQAGPVDGVAVIAGIRKQRLHSARDGGAAHGVQFARVAVQLARAGHAQTLAQARKHQFVAIVRQRDGGCGSGIEDRISSRVTLARIQHQADTQRPQQGRGKAAHGYHHGVRVFQAVTAVDIDAFHARDAFAIGQQARRRRAILKIHAGRGRAGRQRRGKQMHVARLVAGREIAADDLAARVAQGRFQSDHFIGADRIARAAQLAQERGARLRFVKLLLVRIEMQYAPLEVVIFDARFAAQGLQALAAVLGQGDDLAHIARHARWQTFAQVMQRPLPLQRIETGTEQQRRVVLAQPGQHFAQGGGIGPRFRMRDGNLAAIAEARFLRGARLALEHAHVVARLAQIPGRCRTDHAGAEDKDLHGGLGSLNGSAGRRWRQKRRSTRFPSPA
ncbi:hypothetical protein D3C85_930200 [compost metagenome]